MIPTRRLSALVPLLLLFLPGCRPAAEPAAYGNVEAIEVVVGAEASGKIESFEVREGDRLAAGAIVGAIETTGLALELRQVDAERDAAAARIAEIAAQIDALEVEREIAGRAYARTRRLYDQQAATAQSLDQAEGELRVLGERIAGARAQTATIGKQVASITAQAATIDERIAKSRIVNPVAGTVLAVYARGGEVTQAGQPLYRIADLGTLEVRAYVTETQLAAVRVGQDVRVTFDTGEPERRTIPGTVTWISSDAEFTPTPIQTRDERADLVYALEIRVANPDGVLKIGMPVDVDW